jgi:hypothetical protein
MKRGFRLYGALIFLIFLSPFLQSQQLSVQIDAGKQILNRANLEALPHVKVTTSEHGSPPVSFEGVTLKSVLEKEASPSENR